MVPLENLATNIETGAWNGQVARTQFPGLKQLSRRISVMTLEDGVICKQKQSGPAVFVCFQLLEQTDTLWRKAAVGIFSDCMNRGRSVWTRFPARRQELPMGC